MSSAALLDSIWRLLANDPAFLAFKGLAPTSPIEDRADYIQKEEETEGIVDANTIPICLLFVRPGKFDHRSSQVYISKAVIECYAHDGNTARKMAEHTMGLMQNWQPDGLPSFVCRLAYDTSFKTGIPGVKGHRIYYDVSYYVG